MHAQANQREIAFEGLVAVDGHGVHIDDGVLQEFRHELGLHAAALNITATPFMSNNIPTTPHAHARTHAEKRTIRSVLLPRYLSNLTPAACR